jgi:catechol 2,3-dioxygenase-like lactoylglutathione lyase family enzyme
MTRYLHTMYRITDPARSRAFYEALGFEFRREMDMVRDGEIEATNYFFGVPGQDEELELTFNQTVAPTSSVPDTATSSSVSTTSDRHSPNCTSRESILSASRIACARAGR